MNKENQTQGRSGYAAALALRRKQAASQAAANNAPLPRVAVVGGRGLEPQHPPHKKKDGRSTVGVKPATHSTRNLVPLSEKPAHNTASTSAQQPPRAPIPATGPPAANMLVPSTIVGIGIPAPALDSEEMLLQAELELANLQLEQVKLHRRTAPAPPAAAAVPPPAVHPAAVPPAPMGPATMAPIAAPAPAAHGPAAYRVQPGSSQDSGSAAVPSGGSQQQQAAALDAPPSPQQQQAAVPPEDQSIVRQVVTASGTGCRDIIAAHTAATLPVTACWVSRGHRVLHLQSSCILQLWGRQNSDVTLRITFSDPASVPRLVRLEHAPTATAAFEKLGDIKLQAKSLHQLRHLFRLGKTLEVQRFMRITLVGHMAEVNSGAHRVAHMLLTSGHGPQRTRSQQSAAVSSMSAQASAGHSVHNRPQEPATADSAGSKEVSSTAMSSVAPATFAEHTSGTSHAPSVQPPEVLPQLEPDSAEPIQAFAPQPAVAAPAAAPVALPAGASAMVAPAAGPVAASVAPPAAFPMAGPAAALHHSGFQPAPAAAKPAVMQNQEASLGQMEDMQAAMDFQQLLEQEFASQDMSTEPVEPESQPESSSSAAPVELLSDLRREEVLTFLAQLTLSPMEVKEAVLKLFEPDQYHTSVDLTDQQLDDLLQLLPSPEETEMLAAYQGRSEELGSAEQFMLAMLELHGLGEAMQTCELSAEFASQADDVDAAISLFSRACQEVQGSDLLRTLLKVSHLAGNFLSAGSQNGTAPGFQIDALCKLKDVRSTRARSRTLLHFVAREVARQHPHGSSLLAALPSAAAATEVDLGQARAELLPLSHIIGRVEQAIASAQQGSSGGSISGRVCVAYMAAFRDEAVRHVHSLQAKLDQAEEAFRQLGSFINGQRSTMESPPAFFGMLHAFAVELDAAHEENCAADAAATKTTSRDSKQRSGRADASSPTSGVMNHHQDRLFRSVAATSKATSLRRGSSNVAKPAAAEAGDAGTSSQGTSSDGQADNSAQKSKLSTPVENLLEETARMINAMDHSASREAGRRAGGAGKDGKSGFGSAINSDVTGDATASSPRSATYAAQRDTASTPERAAPPAGNFSTPRAAVPLRWQGTQPAAAEQHPRYAATASVEMEALPPAVAAVAAAVEGRAPADSGSIMSVGSQRSLSQLRQRSLQQLSPTSTPLSSLGRQSSRSSVYSSDCGSTPGSIRSSAVHRRTAMSPMAAPAVPGMGAAVAKVEAAAAGAATSARHQGAAPGSMVPSQPSAPAPAAADGGADILSARQLVRDDVMGHQQQTAAAAAAEVQAEEAGVTSAAAFSSLHSRASSMDLTFYAPFGVNREGPSQGTRSHRASVTGSEGSGAWGPLGEQQQLHVSGILRKGSCDDMAVPKAAPAAADRKRVSFSLPSSPRHRDAQPTSSAGSRPPPPLNLSGVADRLQRMPAPASGRSHRSSAEGLIEEQEYQEEEHGPSPVLNVLLSNVPTPPGQAQQPDALPAPVAARASLASQDIAYLSENEEDDWQQLEQMQQQEAQEQRQQQLVQHPHLAHLPQGQQQLLYASQGQLQHWLSQQEVAAQQQQSQSQQQAAAPGLQVVLPQQQELADRLQLAPLQLPSPITSLTTDMDAAVYKLLVCAGNTPSGPLARGVRQAESFAEVRKSVALPVSGMRPSSRQALLEPVMPTEVCPLGEGVRASQIMAQQVPAAALGMSLEGPRVMLLRGSAPGLSATLSHDAAAWEAEQEGLAAAAGQQQQGQRSSLDPSLSQHGHVRRGRLRGLKKFLGKR